MKPTPEQIAARFGAKLCDWTEDELDTIHKQVVSEAGHSSVTSAINEFNCWGMTAEEFLAIIKPQKTLHGSVKRQKRRKARFTEDIQPNSFKRQHNTRKTTAKHYDN